MSSFTCDDKQTLIAYMYDEVDAATRAHVDAHLASCAQCAAEVRALSDVRLELSQWAPPDAELGFAIVRTSEQPAAHVLRPARWWQTVPAWAQAAAFSRRSSATSPCALDIRTVTRPQGSH